MNENHVFADVDLPFHVWVREGSRWVLRDAGGRLASAPDSGARPDPLSPCAEPPAS